MRQLVLLLVLGSGWVVAAGRGVAGEASTGRALRHSDVVFMYDDPKMYGAYGCTVVGWAGSSDPQRVIAAHQQGIRLFSSSVGFLTEFSRVIDFSPDFLDAACRNFEGKPFVVPWLWDHKHKGQPAWWWCTNSPLYRKYLAARLEKLMQAPLDGLHIDDYRGSSGAVTWLSGGFCRHCMAAFRKYLAEHVPREKLAALGITDVERFDYRQYLMDRGVTPEEYRKKRASLPLSAEFLDFHVRANTAFVAEYRKQAERLRGAPLALCVNSGVGDPQALAIAFQVDYFCCEVSHQASSRRVPMHPVFIYKLADGVHRPVASTAGGWDWAYIAEHKLPGLVRTWIALAYAHGHNFMAPHRQWCYTDKKGTHWYQGPVEEYAWLYQFVRQKATLLDGYEAVAAVAVVWDNAARRRGKGNIEPLCAALAEQNVPFTVVVSGDEWLAMRLDASELARFRAVVIPRDLAGDPARPAALQAVQAAGRLVAWPDEKAFARLVPPLVRVEPEKAVGVVPRAKPNEAGAPAILHLLNRQYDAEKDAMQPQQQVVVELADALFGGRRFTRARLHVPRAEPLDLTMVRRGQFTVLHVPRLELWALVELIP